MKRRPLSPLLVLRHDFPAHRAQSVFMCWKDAQCVDLHLRSISYRHPAIALEVPA